MTIRSIASAALCVAAMAAPAAAAEQRPLPRTMLVTIKPLEGKLPQVEAYFNPKELSVDKAVPWNTHPSSTETNPVAEYAGPAPQAMEALLSLQDSSDVRAQVEKLAKLAEMDDELERPPMVTASWGNGNSFRGVIASLSVKYTMFHEDGTPVRAEARIRIQEAKSAAARRPCQTDADCPDGHVCAQSSCVRR